MKFDNRYLRMQSYPTREAIFKAEEQLSHGSADSAKSLMSERAKDMIAQISESVCR